MKKLLLAIVLIVGCDNSSDSSDPLDSCILQFGGVGSGPWYRCYESIYTKQECLDKTGGPNGEYDYHSYIDQTCFEFCSDTCGEGYPSECPDARSCQEN